MLMEKLLLLIFFFRLPSELDSWMISNACTDGKCNIHHLTCNEGKDIQIDSAYYGFTKYKVACKRRCSGMPVYNPEICVKPVSKEDYGGLKNKCNGKQMCYVTTPGQSNNISCDKKKHTVSILYYSCIEETRQKTVETSGFTQPINMRMNELALTMIDKIVTTPNDDLMTTESSTKKTSLTDVPVIVGSVIGCLVLVILFIIILVVIKRRTVISKHIEGSRIVVNREYERTDESYNHGTFSTDNSKSTRGIESDDYNHLHDAKNNNSSDNDDDYNHLGILTAEDKFFSDDYNHLGGVQREQINDDYSHIGEVKGRKVDNSHIGEVNDEKIDDDYSHIGVKNYPSHGQNEDHYNHLGEVQKQVSDISTEIINKDDYNHPGERNYANYINISNYENI